MRAKMEYRGKGYGTGESVSAYLIQLSRFGDDIEMWVRFENSAIGLGVGVNRGEVEGVELCFPSDTWNTIFRTIASLDDNCRVVRMKVDEKSGLQEELQ